MASNSNTRRTCILHNCPSAKRPRIDEGDFWFCDRIKVRKFTYVWKIENFNYFNGETISPIFTNEKSNDIKWQLAITKIGKIVILKLKLVCCDQGQVKFKFRGSMENRSGQTCSNIGKDNLYTAVAKDVFIFPRPIEIEEDSQEDPTDDNLSVRCEICVIDDVIDMPLNDFSINSHDEADLFQNMGKLLESGKFSDVTLMVSGQELKAHKNILSMRSEVFAAMFEHQTMAENKSNCVDINDLDHTVVREMLTFIYTNQAPNVEEMPMDLFVAADKYSLKRLKLMCEIILNRELTCDTALTILILADRHNSEILKLRTIHFIKTNLDAVMTSKDWHTMTARYPQLIEEIQNYNGCVERN
uniref:BTB domain-containing protein n=1 Tax=Musca domestica TaxID=7370 RepID=A0A1I8MWX0_MUSDO